MDLTPKNWYTLSKLLNNFYNKLLDFLFPSYCEICNQRLQNEKYICQKCLKKVKYINSNTCSLCGKEFNLPVSSLCKDCKNNKRYFKEARAIGRYEGVLKDYIHLLKYCNKPYLKVLFPDIVKDYAKWIKNYQFDYIMPIPLHPKKLRKRGYNQAELFAKYLSKAYKIEYYKDNLTRKKETLPQINLDKKERLRNVKSSFIVKYKEKVKDKSILLIDDVYTTGATVNECSKELKESGVKKIIVLTLARS
ncbi:MAG: ComF family protein [bacterium]|nr:ComF family protein [bacterium]